MNALKQVLVVALLANVLLPAAQAGKASDIPLPDLKNVVTEPKAPVQMESGLKTEGEKKIADGTRLYIKQKDFSIMPPKNWERVQSNSGLLYQMQKAPNLNYQKTLQVIFFNGSVSWDNYNLTNFGKMIIDRFARRSNLISDYKLLNQAPFPLEQNTPSQAYYTSFTYGAMPMMQLHVLVSNSTRHALVTFTDLASNFKADVIPEDHRAVYDSLKSIELEGANGLSSFDTLKYIVAAAVALIVVFFLFRTSVSWLRFRQLKNIDSLPTDQHEATGSDIKALREVDKASEKERAKKKKARKKSEDDDDDEAEAEKDENKSDHGLDFSDHDAVA